MVGGCAQHRVALRHGRASDRPRLRADGGRGGRGFGPTRRPCPGHLRRGRRAGGARSKRWPTPWAKAPWSSRVWEQISRAVWLRGAAGPGPSPATGGSSVPDTSRLKAAGIGGTRLRERGRGPRSTGQPSGCRLVLRRERARTSPGRRGHASGAPWHGPASASGQAMGNGRQRPRQGQGHPRQRHVSPPWPSCGSPGAAASPIMDEGSMGPAQGAVGYSAPWSSARAR